MTRRLLNIGVICLDAGQAATVTDHIRAITDGSRHHSLVLPVWPHNTLQHIELGLFDVLVIHYTIVVKEHTFLLPAVREQIAKFPGLKVAFIQDEYRFVNATIDALRELGIRLLFTCVPEGEIEKVYSPERLPGVTVVPVLTGYVPNDLAELEVPPYGHRAIDVGYRSRKVPTWLGDLGWEKYIISVKFPEAAARYRLRLDISCREEDRIYGEDWIRFIYNCKAFLGVESGASVFDFTGDIQRQVEAHEDREPNVGFEELQRLYFAEQEGKIRLNQISPRCFEATSLRTLLVLYEGDYSGILVPWRHYIPLKKDHSNVDEVVKILLDRRRAETVIEAAYSEVACNPEYSFANFSGRFDHEIETMISPEGLRRTNPDHVRKEIAAASGRAALEKMPFPLPAAGQQVRRVCFRSIAILSGCCYIAFRDIADCPWRAAGCSRSHLRRYFFRCGGGQRKVPGGHGYIRNCSGFWAECTRCYQRAAADDAYRRSFSCIVPTIIFSCWPGSYANEDGTRGRLP